MQSQLHLMGLTDANKNIRLINKKMGRGQSESQRTFPNKVNILKTLLRSKLDKANTEMGKTNIGRGEAPNSFQQQHNF